MCGFQSSQGVGISKDGLGRLPVGVVYPGDVAQEGKGDVLDESDTGWVLVGGLCHLVAGDAAEEVLATVDGEQALVTAAEGVGVACPGRSAGGEWEVVFVSGDDQSLGGDVGEVLIA